MIERRIATKQTEGEEMVKVECLPRGFAVRFSAGVVYLLLFSVAASGLTTDGLALLALKSAVSGDPSGALARWHESDPDPCGWPGVTCRRGRVTSLSLPGAALAGYLPSELSLLAALETLALPRNRLSGPIPAALGDLRALASLDLSGNRLSGPIPPAIANLTSLSRLDLSSNLLNGSLPPAIAALPHLSGVLNLSYNFLSGPIPSVYGAIPVDVSLDLQRNNLSGEIPQVGSLVNQGPTAFAGNPGLCGFPLKNPCPGAKQEPGTVQPNPSFNPGSPTIQPAVAEDGRRRWPPAATVPILAGVVVTAVISVIVLQWQFRRRRAGSEGKGSGKGTAAAVFTEERRAGHSGEIYAAVDESFGLELEELLRASAYVVGKSRSGIVYKVVVGRGSAVAVRRLSEGEDGDGEEWRRRRAFEAEAAAIGRANHPNVVRLRAYYYAPDEKLLIYDYIPNGTLHAALHGAPTANPTVATALPWVARLAIIQGAARGLAYLHECSPRKYIHGNVKSSKILLDDELRPFVSGFGLTRLAAGAHNKLPHSASAKKLGAAAAGARESVGPSSAYLAPELRPPGAPATQKGDVYALGVLVLEVLTGRLPVTAVAPAAEGGGAGEEEVELATWVRRAFKEERPLAEVVDPALLGEVHAKKQVLAVFHVALGCTEPDPEVRPRMRAVSESLDRVAQPR